MLKRLAQSSVRGYRAFSSAPAINPELQRILKTKFAFENPTPHQLRKNDVVYGKKFNEHHEQNVIAYEPTIESFDDLLTEAEKTQNSVVASNIRENTTCIKGTHHISGNPHTAFFLNHQFLEPTKTIEPARPIFPLKK